MVPLLANMDAKDFDLISKQQRRITEPYPPTTTTRTLQNNNKNNKNSA